MSKRIGFRAGGSVWLDGTLMGTASLGAVKPLLERPMNADYGVNEEAERPSVPLSRSEAVTHMLGHYGVSPEVCEALLDDKPVDAAAEAAIRAAVAAAQRVAVERKRALQVQREAEVVEREQVRQARAGLNEWPPNSLFD